MEATTFREAYEVLQRHANTLRQQNEPNIDDLLDIVNESVAAYKVCKARIDAVEKALGEALEGAGLDDAQHPQRIEKLSAAASRHRKALGPFDALAALGGFEIAMMVGAMLQAAHERRVVVVDGYVAGAAALVARSLMPAVADYLVFAHRSAEGGHRLMLIHLQAQPLLDMGMRMGQGTGALLAWPLLLAARGLLER